MHLDKHNGPRLLLAITYAPKLCFRLKMYQNVFGGPALHGSTGELTALAQNSLAGFKGQGQGYRLGGWPAL